MRFQGKWSPLQNVLAASMERIWLFLIKNIKKVFTVCNYILQFHYKAHFNSSPNRCYQSSCHFLFRKVIKSGLEIIPFPPVSRILICFIGISLSFSFACSLHLHNLHCHPFPGGKHKLSFSLSFYGVSLHFVYFLIQGTLSSLGQNHKLGAGCWGPVSITAFLADLQQVPEPVWTPSPSAELASAHPKGTQVSTAATSRPKCKSFCSPATWNDLWRFQIFMCGLDNR